MSLKSEDPAHDGQDLAGLDATPLCLQCLAEVPTLATFCAQCSAPVGMFATTDPMQQIQSTGWLYRRAIGSRMSTMAIIGLWLIFGPSLIVSLSMMVASGAPKLDFASAAILFFFLGYQFLCALILYKGTRKYLRQRNAEPDGCQNCGYLLRNLTEHRCPECATPFDPADFETGDHDDSNERDTP